MFPQNLCKFILERLNSTAAHCIFIMTFTIVLLTFFDYFLQILYGSIFYLTTTSDGALFFHLGTCNKVISE